MVNSYCGEESSVNMSLFIYIYMFYCQDREKLKEEREWEKERERDIYQRLCFTTFLACPLQVGLAHSKVYIQPAVPLPSSIA